MASADGCTTGEELATLGCCLSTVPVVAGKNHNLGYAHIHKFNVKKFWRNPSNDEH